MPLVLCAALLVGAYLWGTRSRPSPSDDDAGSLGDDPPAVLTDDVVQWWLDARTPVYFVIRSRDSAEGGAP